jgi:hypothetical protein
MQNIDNMSVMIHNVTGMPFGSIVNVCDKYYLDVVSEDTFLADMTDVHVYLPDDLKNRIRERFDIIDARKIKPHQKSFESEFGYLNINDVPETNTDEDIAWIEEAFTEAFDIDGYDAPIASCSSSHYESPHIGDSLVDKTTTRQTEKECNICMKEYNSDINMPKILKCGHTTCKACLHQLAIYVPERKKHTITCPECRQLHVVKVSIDAIMTNFSMIA